MISKPFLFCSLVMVLFSEALAAPPASKYWDDPKVQLLAEAGKAGDAKKIATLIAEGVSVNAVGREGFTPLAYTMLSVSKKGFVALLKNGADPNMQITGLPGGDGSIAGLAAQAEKDLFWLEQLDAAGADLNIAALRSGKSPIYFAISYHRIENLKWLIEKKVNLEVSDVQKYSPLQYATSSGRWEAVYLLLEAGADWTKTLPKGQTIVDLIQTYSKNRNVLKTGPIWEWRNKVILLLKSKGCDVPPDLLTSATGP